jgi:hypothetical protein
LTVRIEETAREALAVEAVALSDALTDPAARASYEDLSRAIGEGEVEGALLPPLEQLLELTLRTGRVRKLHGPLAEAAAVRVYQATPGGRATGKALAEVNAALTALGGRTIDGVAFSAKGPGVYGLSIDTPDAKLSLEIGPDGVLVRELSVGE